MSLVENKDQIPSNNKYMNNIRKLKDNAPESSKLILNANSPTSNLIGPDSKTPLGFKGLEPCKAQHYSVNQSIATPEKQSKNRGFGKNLFASQFSNDKETQETNKRLFLIPETTRNSEMELDTSDNMSTSISSVPSNRNSYDDRNLRMIEETNLERQGLEFRTKPRGRLDFDDSPANQEGDEWCQNPFKSKKLFVNQEETTPVSPRKQDYQNAQANSRVFAMEFQSNSIFGNEQSNNENFARKENINGHISRFEADFERNELLGSGYFGRVHKCLNRIDGLEYAVKIIRYKKKGASHENQALNEVHALALLSMDENPFIVRYYYAWFEADFLHLVMEYCPSNLKNIERVGIKFSESMIRQVLRDICQGLRHLHKQNIVHLDIKPENILYSRTSKYKIADLGLSRIAERSPSEDINEGDSRYLAPELLNESTDTLPDLTKADIFSLGVTIYELMTRQEMPKNGPEWHSIRKGILPRLDNLKNYSNSLKGIIKLMMSRNPDKRPSASELISNFLPSDIELELKWERTEKELLKKQLNELREKYECKRKNSY